MKRKKIDIDEVLKRHLPRLSKAQIEDSRAQVWERLQKHFRQHPEDFNFGRTEETPAEKAIRQMRQIDLLVLDAIQILGGRAGLGRIEDVVNALGDEVVDSEHIRLSLERLHRKGVISLRRLFGTTGINEQEAAIERDAFEGRNLSKEKL